MIDRPAVSLAPPFALIAVEAWGAFDPARLGAAFGNAAPPAPLASADAGDGWRALWVEPGVWWLYGAQARLADRLAAAEAALGDAGTAVDLTGGFAQARIEGRGWRDRLMVGGVFDAEDPAFAPGRTAGTLLHHVAVRYDVVTAGEVRVFAPPSYMEHLLHHWAARG